MSGGSTLVENEREQVTSQSDQFSVHVNDEAPDITPGAWKMIIVTLGLGALLLVSLAAWVWAGIYRYQNIY